MRWTVRTRALFKKKIIVKHLGRTPRSEKIFLRKPILLKMVIGAVTTVSASVLDTAVASGYLVAVSTTTSIYFFPYLEGLYFPDVFLH